MGDLFFKAHFGIYPNLLAGGSLGRTLSVSMTFAEGEYPKGQATNRSVA